MTIKLIDRKEIAEGTMAFYFSKPDGFTFKAGQNVDMTLVNPPETDAEGNTRAYSLAAPPHEDHLMIATRMRDTAFKRVLKTTPIGTEVEISDPMGSFTLHNDTNKAAVFLMGGIGITPTHSILLDAAERQVPHTLYLFYSNRRPEDAAFLDELTKLQDKNPNYKLIATMTDMAKSSQQWTGETGYITADMIKKYVPDPANAIYYLSGPASMVKAMREVVNSMGINDDYIKTEEFAGY